MAPESDQRLEIAASAPLVTARVHDTITIPAVNHQTLQPGLAVILESYPSAMADRFVGQSATICVAGVRSQPLTICAVRDHENTISFLFEGLNKGDVPIGAQVEFSEPAGSSLRH